MATEEELGVLSDTSKSEADQLTIIGKLHELICEYVAQVCLVFFFDWTLVLILPRLAAEYLPPCLQSLFLNKRIRTAFQGSRP